MAANVLVATPDRALAMALRPRGAEWTCLVATSTEDAVNLARQTRPDVAVVDDRLAPVRGRTAGAWIAFVWPTRVLSIGGPHDTVAALRRPVTATDVTAVVTSAVSRPATAAWGFALDADTLEVQAAHGAQRLTPTEYRLLRVLITAGADGASAASLATVIDAASSLRVHLGNLRRKLGLVTGDAGYVVARGGRYRLLQTAP